MCFQENCTEYSYVQQERNESHPRQTAIAETSLPSLATRQHDIVSQEPLHDYSYVSREQAERHRHLQVVSIISLIPINKTKHNRIRPVSNVRMKL